MLSEKARTTINKAIKFMYDEHVGRLLSIPESHLKKIAPNRGLPIIEILEGYNKDMALELSKYGDEICIEIARLLDKLKLSSFSEEDKYAIALIINEYCQPELYKKRFSIMLDSMDKKLGGYGTKFERAKYRIDLPLSCCEVDAENITRRIKAKIENELSCLVESYKSKGVEKSSKLPTASRYLELKPNFMGIGINLNAVIERLFHKKQDNTSSNGNRIKRTKSKLEIASWLACVLSATIAIISYFPVLPGLKDQFRVTPEVVPKIAIEPFYTNDKSKFIRDVTYPNGEEVRVNQVFKKIWEIQNAGNVEWKDRYLQREGTKEGTGQLISADRVKIPFTVPGQRVQIKVRFQAPSLPGTIIIKWKMVDKLGRHMFPNQEPLHVNIQVIY